MKNVYRQTELGWSLVFKAQSFAHACEVCREMQSKDRTANFCVNN